MFLRHRKVAFTDGVIDLVPIDLYPPESELRFGRVLDYSIRPHGSWREAGKLSLRLGESPALYYFGHIGYHVDPPYRGRHYAQLACRLAMPLLWQSGKHTAVITTDPDNLPSRKTAEALGAVLERTVAVPEWLCRGYGISRVKCRYIWRTEGAEAQAGPDAREMR